MNLQVMAHFVSLFVTARDSADVGWGLRAPERAAVNRENNMRIEAEVTDLAELDIDVAAAELQLVFADVDVAALDVDGPCAEGWTMVREGESLRVRSCEGPAKPRKPKDVVVLFLPKALEQMPPVLSLRLAASKFRGVGAFLALDAEISASEADFAVQATEARIACAASKVRVQLEDVGVADFSVAAGELSVWLKGGAPSLTTVDVAAGSASLIVPPVPYRVEKSVALGKAKIRVKEKASSPNVIEVSVGVGKVEIEAQSMPAPDF